MKQEAGGWSGPSLAVLLLLVTFPLCGAGPVPEKITYSSSHIYTTILIDTAAVRYDLPDSSLATGSESLFVNDTLLQRDIDYTLDYTAGVITLKRKFRPGTVVGVSYTRVSVFKRQRYFHQELVVTPEAGKVYVADKRRAARFWQPAPDDEGNNLKLWGSKSFGLSLGSNQALAVEQALNLNINGTIAKDVKVTASLSDQNTPIPPEGNTQVLREIDGVRIRIEGKNLGVTMGDLQVNYTGTEYSNYFKNLDGVAGHINFKNLGVSGCGAFSEGEFSSYAITGTEGMQGPYFLPDQQGRTGIRVLAGTEQVYVDGVKMVRGTGNDYIIDYGNGAVTFMHRRPITSASRITVDYEYSREAYRRNFYSGRAFGSLWGKRIQYGASVITEQDDRENPLEYAVNNRFRDILRLSGDDPFLAFDSASAVIYDTVNSFYYFRGDTIFDTLIGHGTHAVHFSYIGTGQGDYRYNPVTQRYYFAGKGLGDYLPVTLLPLPEEHLVTDFTLDLVPWPFIRLKQELALSGVDRNTYSAIGDEDNWGKAYQAALYLHTPKLSFHTAPLGSLAWNGSYDFIQNRFHSIGRMAGVEEYDRDWNLKLTPEWSLDIWQTAAAYQLPGKSSVGGEFGFLEQGTAADYSRKKGYLNLEFPKWPAVSGTWEEVESEGKLPHRPAFESRWKRKGVSGSYSFWKLAPRAEYRNEDYQGNQVRTFDDTTAAGFRVDEYSGELATRGLASGRLAGSVNLNMRETELAGEKYSDAVQTKFRAAIRDWHSLTHQLGVTRQERTVFSEGKKVDRAKTYLVTLDNEFSPFNRAVDTDLNYQVTSTQTAPKMVVYDSVGTGYGNYRLDTLYGDSTWVPDPEGTHWQRLVPIGDYEPTIEVVSSAHLALQPKRFFMARKNKKGGRWQKLLTTLSAQTYMTLDKVARSDQAEPAVMYLPRLAAIDTSEILRENKVFRQDLFWIPAHRKLSLRLRYRWNRLDNWESYPGGLTRTSKQQGVRLRINRVFKVDNETEYTYETKVESLSSTAYQGVSHQVTSTIFTRLYKRLDIEAGVRARHETDQNTDSSSTLYALEPSLRYTLGHKGRVSTDGEITFVTDPTSSYQQLEGHQQGWSFRWNLLFDYRVNTYVTYYVSYNGYNEPYVGDRRTVHQGRAEVRATF